MPGHHIHADRRDGLGAIKLAASYLPAELKQKVTLPPIRSLMLLQ
jgi:hypothetical protein